MSRFPNNDRAFQDQHEFDQCMREQTRQLRAEGFPDVISAELHAIGFDFPVHEDPVGLIEVLLDRSTYYEELFKNGPEWCRHVIRMYTDPSGARLLHALQYPGANEDRRVIGSLIAEPTAPVETHRATTGMTDVFRPGSMSGVWFRAVPDDLWDEYIGYFGCLALDYIPEPRFFGLALDVVAYDTRGEALTSGLFTPHHDRKTSRLQTFVGSTKNPLASVCGEITSCELRTNELTGLQWYRLVLDTIPLLTVAVAADGRVTPQVGHFLCGMIQVGVSAGTWDS